MKKLEMPLLTSKYTEVFVEENYNYNAPHSFVVNKAGTTTVDSERNITSMDMVANIHFQEGPIKECGVNGVNNEDLINMVICRLQHFQDSEYACRENALAITKLEEALLWLRARTMQREARGVEGTHTV